MPMVDLDFYEVKAKGKTYRYAWRGRGAPRLYSEPGTAAFIQELADAQASRKTGDKTRMSGLCAMYRASDAWKLKISAKTRASWSPWLDRIQDEFGELRIKFFDLPTIRKDIRRWRDAYAKTPRAADMGLQVLSRLLSFGMEEGLLATNACVGISRIYSSDRAGIIWTADDFAILERHAPAELVWAARLAANTGLRQADLLRLSWSHVKAYSIEISTGKSKHRKTTLIPLHDELKALLDEIPKRSTVILTNTDKRPWRTGFGSSWNKALARAELAKEPIDKHFHDLRGTAATVFYLAGLSIREIAEIMTWSEENVGAMIDRYVKRDELLKDRIERMRKNERRTESEKPTAKPSGSSGG